VLTIFDRYVVRVILLPFFLALVVLTFILLMPPVLENAQQLIEKGVDVPTILRILLTLVPQALSVTIPMALLYGILMGLGRLSTDREFVALQACGVSIFRALRPIALLALLAFAVDQYVLLVALPDANQTFREITFNVVAAKAESDVKPRTFYQGFPNRVVYVRDIVPGGGWKDVFLADNTRADQTAVHLAAGGRLVIDRATRTVQLVLEDGTRHTTFTQRPEDYEGSSFDRLILNLDAESVFKRTTLLKGDNEMTIAELRKEIATRRGQKLPYASQLFTIQQKFSIPVSCLVLAAIGLALGASSRKDGTLASFALGSGVIFIYYVLLYMARAAANGGLARDHVGALELAIERHRELVRAVPHVRRRLAEHRPHRELRTPAVGVLRQDGLERGNLHLVDAHGARDRVAPETLDREAAGGLSELRSAVCKRCRVQLVRRRIREIAGTVRPGGHARCPFCGLARPSGDDEALEHRSAGVPRQPLTQSCLTGWLSNLWKTAGT
jgi:lipopolysaccharide export system permease protein